jgi:hypothetical protein
LQGCEEGGEALRFGPASIWNAGASAIESARHEAQGIFFRSDTAFFFFFLSSQAAAACEASASAVESLLFSCCDRHLQCLNACVQRGVAAVSTTARAGPQASAPGRTGGLFRNYPQGCPLTGAKNSGKAVLAKKDIH